MPLGAEMGDRPVTPRTGLAVEEDWHVVEARGQTARETFDGEIDAA